MNRSQFYHYMNNVNALNSESLEHLKELVEEYPFFHAGRMLLVKNLHLLEDIKYDHELKSAAVHIPDRKRLYLMVHSNEDGMRLETVTEEAAKTDIREVSQESPVVELQDPTQPKLVTDNYFDVTDKVVTDGETIDYSSGTLNRGKSNQQAAIDESLKLEHELNISIAGYQLKESAFDAHKNHSFIEWLGAMGQGQSVDDIIDEPRKEQSGSKQMDLIDSFLQNGKGRIVPTKNESRNAIDISASSIAESDDLMTETLANIHIKQKHYQKAILTFEKLSLKYPEKNSYFAARILELENLIKNQ